MLSVAATCRARKMPIGPAHTQKRKKNLVLMLILLAMVAGLFYLTMLKIQGA